MTHAPGLGLPLEELEQSDHRQCPVPQYRGTFPRVSVPLTIYIPLLCGLATLSSLFSYLFVLQGMISKANGAS